MIRSLRYSFRFPTVGRAKEKKGMRIAFVDKKLTERAAGTDKETLSRENTGHFFSRGGRRR